MPVATLTSECAPLTGFPDRSDKIDDRLNSVRAGYFLPSQNVRKTFDAQDTDDAKRTYRDKVVLKMILVLIGDRSGENLAKWTAAIKALSN